MNYTFDICDKKQFCSDCPDTSCIHCGDAEADCPRYECMYDPRDERYARCESCGWMEYWKEGLYG